MTQNKYTYQKKVSRRNPVTRLVFPRRPPPWSGLVTTEGWAGLRHRVSVSPHSARHKAEESPRTQPVCEIVILFYPTQQIV